MKSFALLSLLAVGSALEFFIESDNAAVSGKGISSIHEGAGINYFFAGDNAEQFSYNTTSQVVYNNEGELVYTVSVYENILMNAVIGPSPIDLSTGYLSINGSADFNACQNINDPYSYSKTQYVITKNEQGDGCIPIKLKVQDSSSSSSSAEVSSTTAASSTTEPSSSSTTSSEAPSSTPNVSTFVNGAEQLSIGGLAIIAALLL